MKLNKVIAAALILMLSLVFAMSGDGGQQPVKPEKKTEAVQVQNEQNQPTVKTDQSETLTTTPEKEKQTEQAKSNETVKDQFGFYTGLNEKEYNEHREAYIQMYMDFKQSVIGNVKYKNEKQEQEGKLRWRETAIRNYEERLNLKAIDKLKKYNITIADFFQGWLAQDGVSPYTYASVTSPIIVHGKITDMTNKGNEFGSAVYDLQVYDILKGNCFFDKKPDLIKVSLWNKRDYKIGNEIIAFLGFRYNVKHNKNNITDESFRTVGTQLIIIDNKVYDGFIPGFMPDTRLIGSIDEVKKTIMEISEIIDFENFYKIDWKR